MTTPVNLVAIGDNRGNLVFANAISGAVTGTVTLARGVLSAPGLAWNSVLYAGESTTQDSTLLHAFDPSGTNVTDRWGAGLSVAGSVDATPVARTGVLWFATSKGNLVGIDNPMSSSPQPRSPVYVCGAAGAPARVSALLAAADGRSLLLVTSSGVYAADVSGTAAVPAWSSLGGVDLTGAAPVMLGDTLFVAAGMTLYAIAHAAGGAQPPDGIEMSASIAVLLPMGPSFLLVGCSDGTWVLLDVARQQSVGRFSLSGSADATAWTRLVGGNLLSFAPDGGLALTSLAVGTSGTVVVTPVWSLSSTAFAAAPVTLGGLAVGLTTAGKLYTYDVENQVAVLSGAQVLAAGAGSVLTTMEMVQGASSARIDFLLDGEEYFPALRNLLIAVLNGSFDTPASLPSDLSFEGLIKAIGNAGKNAYVIMWNTSLLYALTDGGNWTTTQIATTMGAAYFQKLFNSNGAFRGDHRLNSQTQLSLKSTPNVSVYLENYQVKSAGWYDLPVELGSNHQKIVIASVNGTRMALVSGFNTITPSYYDTKAHTMLDSSSSYDGASWHDAGIALTGPAVDLIEAEFDRRWSKANAAPAPSGNTYVKFANWMIARDSILGPASSPPAYVSPLPTAAPVPAQVAITSNETFDVATARGLNLAALRTDVHQILDQLIANIGQATSYIYFENFTFTSADIVSALAAKLKSGPAPGFRIIVMVPHPTVSEFQNEFSMELGQLKLIRLAYAALKLCTTDWDYYTLAAGDIIASTDTTVVNFDRRGIEYTTLTFIKGASTHTVPIAQVVSIHSTAAQPQLCMCSPARYFSTPPADADKALQGYAANFRGVYIHSKLALFDDRVAVVGSANFSRRSLHADGELSVFVNDPATAEGIRTELFGHWNMTTAANWANAMASFAATSTASLGVLPLNYASLPNQPVSSSWSLLTTFVDPSQLL